MYDLNTLVARGELRGARAGTGARLMPGGRSSGASGGSRAGWPRRSARRATRRRSPRASHRARSRRGRCAGTGTRSRTRHRTLLRPASAYCAASSSAGRFRRIGELERRSSSCRADRAFTASGFVFSAALTSTTSPDTGAYSSDTALTDSIVPNDCPGFSFAPTSGSSM